MKKKLIILMMMTIMLVGCGTKKADKEDKLKEVHISAAASLTDAVGELAKDFEKENNNFKIIPNYAGSGALQSQIEEGAPCDIFISAADKQMDALENKGLIVKDSRVELLKNEVILISPIDSTTKVTKFEDILQEKDRKIAIADPASVPVGQYSEQIFTKLGIWENIKPTMVMSQDVRQTLDWVVTKNVNFGVVYKTDAIIEKEKVKILATAPKDSHKDVNYPIALIKDDENSKKFYEFLKSDDAKKVFEKYGFTVNK